MPRKSNGDGSLRQRPDGTWEYRAVIGMDADGKMIRKSFYSKDKSGREAKKKYRDFLSGKEEGRIGIGLRSIRTIAGQYGGTAAFEMADGRFRTAVILLKRDETT